MTLQARRLILASQRGQKERPRWIYVLRGVFSVPSLGLLRSPCWRISGVLQTGGRSPPARSEVPRLTGGPKVGSRSDNADCITHAFAEHSLTSESRKSAPEELTGSQVQLEGSEIAPGGLAKVLLPSAVVGPPVSRGRSPYQDISMNRGMDDFHHCGTTQFNSPTQSDCVYMHRSATTCESHRLRVM